MKKFLIIISLLIAFQSTFGYAAFLQKAVSATSKKLTHVLAGSAVLGGYLWNQKQNPAKAEHIFYKENGEQITEQEHERLYQIMLEQQFPTCTLYGNSPGKKETEVLQDKIQEKYPNIKAAFIPTTLYELAFIKMIGAHFSNEANTMGEAGMNDQIFKDSAEKNETKSFFQGKNQGKSVKKYHLSLNQYIINHLKNNKNSDLTWQEYKSLLPTKNDSPNLNIHFIEQHLEKIIALEYKAHENGEHLLYRGEPIYQHYNAHHYYEAPRKNQKINIAVSYGTTLFAGHFFDRLACAYHYLGKQHKGHLLPLDKQAYSAGNLKNMFYIPPLTTLMGLISGNTYFHARTKLLSQEDAGLLKGPYGYWHDGYTDIPHERFIQGVDAITTYDSIFEYIKNHHILFE